MSGSTTVIQKRASGKQPLSDHVPALLNPMVLIPLVAAIILIVGFAVFRP